MYARATLFVLSNSEGSRRVLLLGNEGYPEVCLELTFRENMLGNVTLCCGEAGAGVGARRNFNLF